MEESRLLAGRTAGTLTPILSDTLSVISRHLRLVALAFLGILAGTIVYVVQLPNQYKAQTKVFLHRGRIDPLVTSAANATARLNPIVTDAELNSELELMRSRDLLLKVVVTCGLHEHKSKSAWASLRTRVLAAVGKPPLGHAERVARAVRKLERRLEMEPLRRSNLVQVTYQSTDPEESAYVLNTLANLYLEKHLAVHRPPGTFSFFQEQTERYRKKLKDLEARISQLGVQERVVSPQLEKEIMLQKLADFKASLEETRAGIARTEDRMASLEAQAATVPPRLTTRVRKSSRVPQHLESTLLELELKRIELMGTFQPDYPPLQQVQDQIRETRAAIAASQTAPLEEATDRNPTYEWIRSELVKSRAQLADSKAHDKAISRAVSAYENKVRRLAEVEIAHKNLIREIDIAKQNYMAYFRKQEDARVSDAMDRQRIVNVAIAEAATPPLFPSGPPRLLIAMLGAILGAAVGIGIAFVADAWDPYLRTPGEVESLLSIPVVAPFPIQEEQEIHTRPLLLPVDPRPNSDYGRSPISQ